MSSKNSGALGVVVIAVALVGALFGAYFAGITGEEHDVVKYNYLADISGLFEYDKSPQYIEYDPSSNYTGYYSVNSDGYWPSGEVGYTPTQPDSQGNPRVNNYKINLAPNAVETTTADFTSLASNNIPGLDRSLTTLAYYVSDRPYSGTFTGYDVRSATTKSTTLTSLLSTMTYEDITYASYQQVKIASETPIVDVSSGSGDDPYDTGWVVFFASDWVTAPGYQRATLSAINPEFYDDWKWEEYMSVKKAPLALSCVIDTVNRSVELYWNNDYTDLIGVYSLDSVSMAHGHRNDPLEGCSLTLGNGANVVLSNFPPASYLDPSKGVFMED